KVEDFVRCTKCSGQLEEVPKERILEMFNSDGELKLKMPARKILESHRVFWICKKCNQVYWKGSHWRKIIDFVSSLRG
ncbi:MAG: Mut7-C RNAse domain-containing protein, partial [Candidatus Micrarchaeota archaeon]|nr:Mut7-C RNAse domain-containing protein [Candidatus Micrarchaeota archaeon]